MPQLRIHQLQQINFTCENATKHTRNVKCNHILYKVLSSKLDNALASLVHYLIPSFNEPLFLCHIKYKCLTQDRECYLLFIMYINSFVLFI